MAARIEKIAKKSEAMQDELLQVIDRKPDIAPSDSVCRDCFHPFYPPLFSAFEGTE